MQIMELLNWIACILVAWSIIEFNQHTKFRVKILANVLTIVACLILIVIFSIYQFWPQICLYIFIGLTSCWGLKNRNQIIK